MKMPEKTKYWFYAKRYGWGWGLPARWEGWVVLLGYLALILGGTFSLMSAGRQPYFFGYFAFLTILLLAICWWKGEPPKWRWGEVEEQAKASNLNSRGLLLLHLFIGPSLLALACYFHSTPPGEINNAYGYRTAASMRNQETWDEAQSYSSRALIVAALATMAYQVASCFLMKPIVSLITSCVVLVTATCLCIPLTELHLKTRFPGPAQPPEPPPIEQPLPS